MQIACCPDYAYVATPRRKSSPHGVRPSYRRVLSGRSRGGRFNGSQVHPRPAEPFSASRLCVSEIICVVLSIPVSGGRPDRPLPTEIRSRAEIQRAAVAIYLLTSRHEPERGHAAQSWRAGSRGHPHVIGYRKGRKGGDAPADELESGRAREGFRTHQQRWVRGGPPAGCGGTVGFRDATGSPLVTAPSAPTADTHKFLGFPPYTEGPQLIGSVS
jgi:hypothetical protein